MHEHTCSTGFMIATLTFLLVLPGGWSQHPKPDGVLRVAWEEEARTLLKEAGDDFQRYVVHNMMLTSVSSYGNLQAARSYVKGYENLHGYKLRFEPTWLEK